MSNQRESDGKPFDTQSTAAKFSAIDVRISQILRTFFASLGKVLCAALVMVMASHLPLHADSFSGSVSAILTDSTNSTTYLSPTLGSFFGDPSDPAPYGTFQYDGAGIFEVDLSGLGDESCTSDCSLTFSYTGPTNTTQNYEVVDDPGLPTQQTIDQSFSISTPGSFGINVGTFGTSVTFQFLDPSYYSTNFLSATFNGQVSIPIVDAMGNQVNDGFGNPEMQPEDVSAVLAAAPASPVPEPNSIALLSTGLLVLGTRFRKKKLNRLLCD